MATIKHTQQQSPISPITLKPTFKAWEHQERLAEWANTHHNSFWQADCGTGKSKAALLAAYKMQSRLTLILTLKRPMTSVWPEQIEDTLDGVRTLILSKGTSKTKAKVMLDFASDCTYDRVPGIVVVNYETARLLPLNAVKWDLIIADESHKLAAHNSAVSKDIARMCGRIPKKIAMTGTGWANRPLMVYGQLRWFKPVPRGAHVLSEDFGGWGAFFDTYANYYIKDDIKIPTGWKNLDKLADTLNPYMIQVRKEDVLELPERFEIIRKVELKPAHRKVYDQLDKDMVTFVDGKMVLAQNVLVLAMRLHQLTGGTYKEFNTSTTQTVKDGDAKLEELADLLIEVGGEPVVVFTRFDDDVRNIQALCNQLGISHAELTGTKDDHQNWQAGKGQVLIANIKAGGTGIDLTRANYMIYYSLGHSRVEFEQSLDRVHRPGQNRNVFIYYIVAKDTIDEDILFALKAKGEVSEDLKEKLRGRKSATTDHR